MSNINQKKKYIGDIIEEEYKNWKAGDIILIKSPTGSGKTYFIEKNLSSFCQANRKSILILSNRTILKDQTKNDMKTAFDLSSALSSKLKVCTYQQFDKFLSNGTDALSNYDYVVSDEAHYFFADSEFNRYTNTILRQTFDNKNSVTVLISATPELIELYFSDKITKTYKDIPLNLNDSVMYTYNTRKEAIAIIEDLRNKYPEDKIMYFTSNISHALDVKNIFSDSAFICSKHNRLYKKYIDVGTVNEIVEKSKFDCKILIATTSLDNGINIKDESVKHIILDVFNPLSTIQCLGRKRLQEGESINIYLKNYGIGSIKQKQENCESKLQQAIDLKSLSKNDFVSKYKKTNTDRLLDKIINENGEYDFEINECIYHWLKYIEEFCELISQSKGLYKDYLCKKLNVISELVNDYLGEAEGNEIELFLKKYLNKRLFGNEQDIFKEEFFKLIKTGKQFDIRGRGLKTINGIISDDNLNYKLISKRTKSRSENRDKYYWIVNEIK